MGSGYIKENTLKEKVSNSLEGQLPAEAALGLMFNLEIGLCFQRGVKGQDRWFRAPRCLKTGWVCVCEWAGGWVRV